MSGGLSSGPFPDFGRLLIPSVATLTYIFLLFSINVQSWEKDLSLFLISWQDGNVILLCLRIYQMH